MTNQSPAAVPTPARPAVALQLLRAACHLVVVLAVIAWGFFTWPSPWLWLTGPGFGLLAVLIWALFLSPRAVLHTDRFGQALIELLFIASGIGALLGLQVNWVVTAVFGLFAAALGYIASTKNTN